MVEVGYLGVLVSIYLLKHEALCSSRKNQYPPHGRSLEIPRGRGFLEAKFLEAMYENKLEFPGSRGGGVQNKKPSVGGVWIFSGTAHYYQQQQLFYL